MDSLRIILELNPDKIFPGHGPEVMNPVAKIREYIAHRLKREEAILSVLPTESTDALSASDIVKLIYTVCFMLFLCLQFRNIASLRSSFLFDKRTFLRYFTQQRPSMSHIT